MGNLDITEGLAPNVFYSLEKAIEANSPKTVKSFITFFRAILRETIVSNEIKTFRDFIPFPTFVYSHITYRARESQIYGDLVRKISSDMSLHIKELIGFNLAIAGQRVFKKGQLRDYYYEAFKVFNDLFFLQAKYQDWNLLLSSLNRYRQLDDNSFQYSRKLNWMKEIIQNNDDNKRNDQVKQLQAEIAEYEPYNRFRRQLLAALKYWLFLLFEEKLLPEETLLNLLEAIGKSGFYDRTKEIEDILYFRVADLRDYMGWENWDFQDRPENEVFYPPMPSKWMTRGFVIDRIRNRNSFFNSSDIDQELTDGIPFLYDAVKEDITSIRDNFEVWKRILNIYEPGDFEKISGSLLTSIALAKKSVIGEKEEAIAGARIDSGFVSEFRKLVGEAWRNQTRIRRVFNLFGNIKDVTNTEIKLKRIGVYTFFEKAKMLFISGEHHSSIYGMEEFGGNVAKWEDNLFLEVLEKSEPYQIEDKTLLSTLNKSIDYLRRSGIEPNVIFLEPEYLYKDSEFLKSEKYSESYEGRLNPDNLNLAVLGTFDNIPLFTSNSFQLKNKIVVSKFEESFLMYHKTNDEWIDGELSVIVNEVSDALADAKFAKEPDKWRFTDEGIELSENDAKILIKTSVLIDIETIADFKVVDKTQFVIGRVAEQTFE